MGNGKGLFISHVGSANICSSTSNKSLFLTDLLHVSEITNNLLSVSKFCRDNKVFFEFHYYSYYSCYVLDQETKRVLLQDFLKDDLYIFLDSHSLIGCSVHLTSFIVDHITANLWQKHFGHCNLKILKKILACCTISSN